MTARSELETLTKRRDGIVSQLGALRDLVASFGGDSPGNRDRQREGHPPTAEVPDKKADWPRRWRRPSPPRAS